MIVRKPLIVLSVLTLLYGGYYWGIPAAVNIKHNISYVEKRILNDAGVRVKISDPKIKMGLTPAVWLMAENTSVLNGDNSSALSLEHTAVKFLTFNIWENSYCEFFSRQYKCKLCIYKGRGIKTWRILPSAGTKHRLKA